jgi:hypothetical protein
VDIGPYVALIALAIGTPYIAWKRQWMLAGYFLLTAAAIVFGTFLGNTTVASALTWIGLVFLAVGIYQLFRQRKDAARSSA